MNVRKTTAPFSPPPKGALLHRSKKMRKRLLLLIPFVLLFAMLVPMPAYAGILGDMLDVPGMLKKTLLDFAGSTFNMYYGILGKVGDADFIQGAFTNLFGTEEPYRVIKAIHTSAIIPVAQAILGLFMLMQLIKISQRIDATSTLPAVKDIVFLVVIYCLMSWFINNSLEVVQAIYDIFNDMIGAVAEHTTAPNGYSSAIEFTKDEASQATLGGCFMVFLLGFLSVFIGILAYGVSMVVALARAIQIYVLAVLSPVPISLMGFEETKQIGIGYLKNFAAACLAGVIMMLILYLYPHIVSSLIVDSGGLSQNELLFIAGGTLQSMDMVAATIKWLAASIVLIIGLVKSGSWAKEILGA